jgi:hypothetical protein
MRAQMRIELSGSSRSTARPFRHRFLFTPAILRDYSSFRSLARRWLGRLLPAPSPPRQCGQFCWRGEHDRDHFDRPSRQKSAHPCGVFCCAIARMPEAAPATSRQRMYLSPRLLVRPSRSLPPEEFWRGVMPKHNIQIALDFLGVWSRGFNHRAAQRLSNSSG